jgi:hypothetical protein
MATHDQGDRSIATVSMIRGIKGSHNKCPLKTGLTFRRFCRATDVRMPEPYRACLDCGLVWNHLHPGRRRKLREILVREGIKVASKEVWPELD